MDNLWSPSNGLSFCFPSLIWNFGCLMTAKWSYFCKVLSLSADVGSFSTTGISSWRLLRRHVYQGWAFPNEGLGIALVCQIRRGLWAPDRSHFLNYFLFWGLWPCQGPTWARFQALLVLATMYLDSTVQSWNHNYCYSPYKPVLIWQPCHWRREHRDQRSYLPTCPFLVSSPIIFLWWVAHVKAGIHRQNFCWNE